MDEPMCSLTRSKAVLRVADGKLGFYTWQFDTGASLRNWHQLKRSTSVVPGFGSLFSIPALSPVYTPHQRTFPAHHRQRQPSWFAATRRPVPVYVRPPAGDPRPSFAEDSWGHVRRSHQTGTVQPRSALLAWGALGWGQGSTRKHCHCLILFSIRIVAHEQGQWLVI